MTEEIIINEKSLQAVLKRCNELEQENKRYKQLLQGCPADGDDCGFCEIDKRNKELEQENKELKEEIQFHNKENSNLLAERNAAQIGYDVIREVRERYRSALEEIMEIISEQMDITDKDDELMCVFGAVYNKIKEVLK